MLLYCHSAQAGIRSPAQPKAPRPTPTALVGVGREYYGGRHCPVDSTRIMCYHEIDANPTLSYNHWNPAIQTLDSGRLAHTTSPLARLRRRAKRIWWGQKMSKIIVFTLGLSLGLAIGLVIALIIQSNILQMDMIMPAAAPWIVWAWSSWDNWDLTQTPMSSNMAAV